MKKFGKTNSYAHGITLIETLIFTVLLSFLMGSLINYLYGIHVRNSKLLDEIHETQKGFIATTAVLLLSLGMLGFLLVTLGASVLYADSVERREARIQKYLNEQACKEMLPLVLAKDHSFEGGLKLSDLNCFVRRE